jgi:indole-3-glycerol phosphate synthase
MSTRQYIRHNWTKKNIIAEIKRIKKEKGRINPAYLNTNYSSLYQAMKQLFGRINPGYLDEHHSGLYGAIGRQFGGGDLEKGWNKAVKAAGFKPEAMRVWNKWGKEKIIAELKRIKKEEGRIDISYLYKNYHKLYTAIKRHFGEKIKK